MGCSDTDRVRRYTLTSLMNQIVIDNVILVLQVYSAVYMLRMLGFLKNFRVHCVCSFFKEFQCAVTQT